MIASFFFSLSLPRPRYYFPLPSIISLFTIILFCTNIFTILLSNAESLSSSSSSSLIYHHPIRELSTLSSSSSSSSIPSPDPDSLSSSSSTASFDPSSSSSSTSNSLSSSSSTAASFYSSSSSSSIPSIDSISSSSSSTAAFSSLSSSSSSVPVISSSSTSSYSSSTGSSLLSSSSSSSTSTIVLYSSSSSSAASSIPYSSSSSSTASSIPSSISSSTGSSISSSSSSGGSSVITGSSSTGLFIISSSSSTGIASNSSDPDDPSLFDRVFSFHLNFKYGGEIEHVISIALLISSPILSFYGVKLFKPALFSLAFVVFGALTYYLTILIRKDGPDGSRDALIAGIIIGLIGGFLVLKIWKFSLFCAGATVGFIFWLSFKSMFPTAITANLPLYLTLVIPCVIFGFLGVKLEKLWLLFSTPVVGAFFLLQGLSHFTHANISVFYILYNSPDTCKTQNCYIIYSAAVLDILFGIIIQYRYTSGLYEGNYKNLDEEKKKKKRKKKKKTRRRKRKKKKRKKKKKK